MIGISSRTWLAVILAAELAGLSSSAANGSASSIAAPAADERLTVEVDPRMFQAEAHRGWVEEQARTVLDRRASDLEDGDGIVVDLAGMSRDYRVTIRVLRHGEPLAEQPETFECRGSTDELLALVEVGVEQAVDRLIEARTREQAERERQARERAERERTAQAELMRRNALATKPYRPAMLGLMGAVTAGLGGGLMVSGALVSAKGIEPSGNDLLSATDFRPPGYALLGVGAAVLTTGVVLLVTDVVRCKRDRVVCGERGPLLERMAGPRQSRGWVAR